MAPLRALGSLSLGTFKTNTSGATREENYFGLKKQITGLGTDTPPKLLNNFGRVNKIPRQ
jgi:hypothetical protein